MAHTSSLMTHGKECGARVLGSGPGPGHWGHGPGTRTSFLAVSHMSHEP